MTFKSTVVLCFLFCSMLLSAQDVSFEKENFPNQKDQLKEAKNELKKGDDLMETGEGSYKAAIPFYLKAQAFNPNNAMLNLKLGVCYLKSNEKRKALPYFEKAYLLNSHIDPDIYYYLGVAYQLDMQFDKAIEQFLSQKKVMDPADAAGLREVQKRIDECHNAQEMIKKPQRVFIDNMGDNVNTPYNDYAPVISADESVMMFTSRRPGGVGGDQLDPAMSEPFEDIWVSYKKGKTWTKAVNLGTPINTDYHDAVVALSPDGQKLIIFLGKKGNGDLYLSQLTGDKWSVPESLGKLINTDYHEPSATFSYDGKTLFFVSNRPGGQGDHDIYIAKMNPKGKWETVVNAGTVINTPYDEDGVYMMPDGKTLYFCSKGHNSMGGYDIFKTTYENGQFTKPENVGYPINTPDQDAFFQLSASGTHAYYSSAAAGSLGGQDIFRITILGPEKDPLLSNEDNLLASVTAPVNDVKAEKALVIKSPKMTLLRGVILDEVSNAPLDATIELIDNEKNELLATFTSNSLSGKYLVSLPSGKNYGIAVKRDGYLFHSENFDLPADADYQEVEQNIALKKIDIGKTIVLKNIFFDSNKSSIRSESASELDRLIKLLTDNPTLRIELGSHTDNKGSDVYNQKLSMQRSQAVVDYLISKGIAANRLEAKGYGESTPIASNDTEEGRQENRRTEFKILSK